MLKKSRDEKLNSLRYFSISAFNATFLKNVGESDLWYHLVRVSDNFRNSAHYVMFGGDKQRNVILIGDV